MPEVLWGRHNRWLTVITVDPTPFGADWEAIRLALDGGEHRGASAPSGHPETHAPAAVFHGCEGVGGDVAEDLFARGLCLPSGSNLTEADLARVATVVRRLGR